MPLRRSMTKSWPTYRPIRLYGSSNPILATIFISWLGGRISTASSPPTIRRTTPTSPNGVTYQRNANFTTNTLLDTDNTTPVAISIDPFFVRVLELPPESDFYVRDWTSSPTNRDTGLEPSTNPVFYINSDVWNRRSNAPGGFNANDQPQSQDPQMISLGDNFAFAARLRAMRQARQKW